MKWGVKLEDLTLQVIHARDLNPGDFVIVKARPEDIQNAGIWAEQFFRPCNVRVGVMLTSMEIQIIRDKQ